MTDFQENDDAFKEFKINLFKTDRLSDPLNKTLEQLIKDEKSYENFFKWILKLCAEKNHIMDKRVILEVLVKCRCAEKKLKISSLVMKNFYSLLPNSDLFLTFFSFLFSSTSNHKRGTGIRCMNRCSKKAIALWYSTKGPVEVARECLQVRTRGGWSHRDVIHMSHLSFADPGMKLVVDYIFKGWKGVEGRSVGDEERAVHEVFKDWQDLQETCDENVKMEVVRKHFHLPSTFFNHGCLSFNMRLLLLEKVAAEGLLSELVSTCRYVSGGLDQLEYCFVSRVNSLQTDEAFKSIRPLDVFKCLHNQWVHSPLIKQTLETLLYRILASFEASSRKVLIKIALQRQDTKLPYHSFLSLASFYISCLCRLDGDCSIHPSHLPQVDPKDLQLTETVAYVHDVISNIFEEDNCEWLQATEEADVLVVLTAECSLSFFQATCAQVCQYRQELKKPSLVLVIIDLGVPDDSIHSDPMHILLNGSHPRCLHIFNQICLL